LDIQNAENYIKKRKFDDKDKDKNKDFNHKEKNKDIKSKEKDKGNKKIKLKSSIKKKERINKNKIIDNELEEIKNKYDEIYDEENEVLLAELEPEELEFLNIKNNIKSKKNLKTNTDEDKYKSKIHNNIEKKNHEINMSLNEDNSYSEKSEYIELSKQERTLLIKNLEKTIDEEQLKNFIKENTSEVSIDEIRIVRDKKGFSKGYAFVDFEFKEDAERCLKNINGLKLENEELICAISKPPSAG
jgi:RNA recognition motif-containing protein